MEQRQSWVKEQLLVTPPLWSVCWMLHVLFYPHSTLEAKYHYLYQPLTNRSKRREVRWCVQGHRASKFQGLVFKTQTKLSTILLTQPLKVILMWLIILIVFVFAWKQSEELQILNVLRQNTSKALFQQMSRKDFSFHF